MNKEYTQEDRLMTRGEQADMHMSRQQEAVAEAIALAKAAGLSTKEFEQSSQEIDIKRRVIRWLDSITDPAEKLEVLERIKTEGFPAEVFADDDNFVVDANSTIN